jgi:hypothetical protein
MDYASAQRWLDDYVHAWLTYDPAAIAALFTADATYHFHPYGDTVHRRDAIVASWLEQDRRDAPNTYRAHYQPVAVDGSVVVANGRSTYFEPDGVTVRTEFDNVFILRFDVTGRCSEFREWYMERR